MRERDIAYYGMTKTINKLYQDSKNKNHKHNKLMKIISSKKNIMLAIKTVSSNTGRNTRGLDNISFEEFLKKDDDIIVEEIRNILYHKKSIPSKRVYIPKNNGKKRPLEIGSIKDRIAQQCFLNVLIPITEANFSQNSYGFRPQITTKHAFAKIVDVLWKGKNDWFVMDIDLEKYYETIPIEKVLDTLRSHFNITDSEFFRNIKRVLYSDTYDNGKVIKSNGIGLPQGGILSPILANVYLHTLDITLDKLQEPLKGHKNMWELVRKDKWDKYRKSNIYFKYVRYADDIRIITPTKKEAEELLDVITNWCTLQDIKVNKDKTKIYHTSDNPSISMLGFTGSRKPNGFTVRPTEPAKLVETLRKHKNACKTNGNNPSSLVATFITLMSHYDICTNLQYVIKTMETWLNATKRGGYKLPVKRLYKNNDRRFYILDVPNRDGEMIFEPWIIREQTKKSISNYLKTPFITDWNNTTNRTDCVEYIESMTNQNHNGKCIIYLPGLLHRQKFKCYVSGKILTPSLCEIHHKKPLYKGGTDSFTNLVLLDKDVHEKLHSKNNEHYYKDNERFIKLKKQLEI